MLSAMKDIVTFLAMREQIRKFAEGLSQEEALRIPPGFSNNIAWNIGHIVVTHQVLCYKLSGLPMHVDDDAVARFIKGSSPAAWESAPDFGALAAQLVPLAERFVQDHEAGLFQDFKPYTTSAGVELTDVEIAFGYNLMHEGVHFGYARAQSRIG